ncbi:right-handed parallel beta-helix repeat-containing protein [Candidatus Bathyarchaeota archaeon]|nr:right-handed parallel beta-helix repeat-containing protein [Candidatus Bathyarchaeota archaeon]
MANFIPEPIPPGIRINSDGTVEGTDKIHREGNVYTLTDDIYSTIVVLRDNVVIDGAGHVLKGDGNGTGIFLQERNGVTIKNLKICNFEYGIKFTWLNFGPPAYKRSNRVYSNIITNNTYGIVFYDFSSGSEVSDNYIANNTYGVAVATSGVVFRNNQFWNNDFAISENVYVTSNIDTSNMVNGKPIYYWVGQRDKTVPSDAGWVVLKNCSGIIVEGLSIEHNTYGILLCYTTNSKITGNIVKNNLYGIMLWGSSSNIISRNIIMNNEGYGIRLDGNSNNNIISNNKITANAGDGINFETATSNTIYGNHITGNGGNGIFFRNIQDSNVIGNNISFNKGCGIGFGYGPNGTIKENHISKNEKGIWISNAFENTITLNKIIENNGWAIELEGSQKNNFIHHNNFINNCPWEERQARVAPIWIFPGEPEPPKLVGGAANFWDDGKEGNYWSDYKGADINGDGIGDTPYIINENNMDNHPLMKPVAIPEIVDATPPIISIISPKNMTYKEANVPLTLIVDESISWIGYSLDGKANITITGNTTLTNLSNGCHSLKVYAEDAHGNIGFSETIYFTVERALGSILQIEEPLEELTITVMVIAAVVGVIILFSFMKSKRTGSHR